VVRPIVRDWRRLSGGSKAKDQARRTLIACSGGVDSMALTIALASATTHLAIAHIIHDMRPRSEALASRDAAKDLATRLDLPFFEREIAAKSKGHNYEAAARTLRYAALECIAKEHACPFIATAHHADDQLETMLMRLVRGAGPEGMAGLLSSRPLNGCRLIRPMLAVTRDDAITLCRATHTDWVEDTTNHDNAHLRSALRHRVVPLLKELAPKASAAAVRAAKLQHQTIDVLVEATVALIGKAEDLTTEGSDFRWNRADLQQEPAILVGELIRRTAMVLNNKPWGDRSGLRAISAITDAIKDDSTEPRHFSVNGIEILVTARDVRIRPLSSNQ